jgi:hypothetical protein
MMMGTFIYLIIFSSIIYKFDKDWAAHTFELAKTFFPLAMTVSIFYFGYYALKQVKGDKKK